MKNILYLLLSGAAILCLPNALWAQSQCEFNINPPQGQLTCNMTSLPLNAELTNVDSTLTYTYLWTRPNGTTSMDAEINANTPGTYTLTVTGSSMDGNQECMKNESIVISQDITPPNVSISPPNPQICTGQTIMLTALPPNASSYNWSNGSTTGTIMVNTPGPYSITVIGANGCSGAAATFVEELRQPNVAITGNGGVLCPGESRTLNAIANTTVSSYQWERRIENGGWVGIMGEETLVTGPLTQTTYYRVTIETPCGSAISIEISVAVSETGPRVEITGNDGVICTGDSRALNAIANTTVTSYQWERRIENGGWEGITGGETLETGTLTQSTYYRVTVQTPCGSDTSSEVMVKVVPRPEPTIDGPTAVCRGQQVIYRLEGDATTIRSSTITWDAGTGQDTAQLSPLSGGAILVSSGNDPGPFNLRVTQQLGSCIASADVSVTVGSAAATTQPTEIRYYDLNNIFISRDPDADCYQWGYYDPFSNTLVDIPGETYQAYAAGEAYNPDRTYWVKTWNGDCSAMPDCATLSFRTQQEEAPELPAKETITLYPNPNDGNCFLRATGLPSARYTLTVTDAMGRKLLQQPLNVQDGQAEAQIALPRAVNGLYHAILVEPNGRLFKAMPFLVLR